MTPTDREQKLVDIMFQVAGILTDTQYAQHFQSMSREQRMEWVAHQLRACGFDTNPMGLSWGVLVSETPEEKRGDHLDTVVDRGLNLVANPFVPANKLVVRTPGRPDSVLSWTNPAPNAEPSAVPPSPTVEVKIGCCTRCGGQGGWEAEFSSTRGGWVKCACVKE